MKSNPVGFIICISIFLSKARRWLVVQGGCYLTFLIISLCIWPQNNIEQPPALSVKEHYLYPPFLITFTYTNIQVFLPQIQLRFDWNIFTWVKCYLHVFHVFSLKSIYIVYEFLCFTASHAKTIGPRNLILHIFRSVYPPHGQWPAPIGSWRVHECYEEN